MTAWIQCILCFLITNSLAQGPYDPPPSTQNYPKQQIYFTSRTYYTTTTSIPSTTQEDTTTLDSSEISDEIPSSFNMVRTPSQQKNKEQPNFFEPTSELENSDEQVCQSVGEQVCQSVGCITGIKYKELDNTFGISPLSIGATNEDHVWAVPATTQVPKNHAQLYFANDYRKHSGAVQRGRYGYAKEYKQYEGLVPKLTAGISPYGKSLPAARPYYYTMNSPLSQPPIISNSDGPMRNQQDYQKQYLSSRFDSTNKQTTYGSSNKTAYKGRTAAPRTIVSSGSEEISEYQRKRN